MKGENKKKIKFYEPFLYANIEISFAKDKILKGSTNQYEKDGIVYYTLQLEDSKDFYTLMHECLHLTNRVFTDRGIPFNAENDEVIAYYQSYWFKRIWRRINKK